jgi:hypothetical protein
MIKCEHLFVYSCVQDFLEVGRAAYICYFLSPLVAFVISSTTVNSFNCSISAWCGTTKGLRHEEQKLCIATVIFRTFEKALQESSIVRRAKKTRKNATYSRAGLFFCFVVVVLYLIRSNRHVEVNWAR